MNKKAEKIEFSIKGIEQNHLKKIEFSAKTSEIILISGVSGSGKSTLVNEVIVAEANRQEAMRRKTDDLYIYSVRPKIASSTQLPPAISVSQRAIVQTQQSTFGTRTGLRKAIQKIFVAHGKIMYKDVQIHKPSLAEISEFSQRYHPRAKLYAVLSSYEPVSRSFLLTQLKKYNIDLIYCRDEKRAIFKQLPITKLPTHGLSDYEFLVDLACCSTDEIVIELAKFGILLIDENLELNFNEHYFYLPDGMVFRRPSQLLFSKSTASSLSGRCKVCNGTGSCLSVDISNVLNVNIPIECGLLNVPLSKTGRYLGFKFLPNGLTTLLKKQGVDVKRKMVDLPNEFQKIIINVLTDKLINNQKDEQALQYLTAMDCSECRGTGYSYQTRAVLVGGKPIHDYLTLTANEFSSRIAALDIDEKIKRNIEQQLNLIQILSIDHISLDRSTNSISSGEAQRIKLLDLCLSQESDKIVVIDEPSSNLQYRDNLQIIDIILEIKSRNNSVIIVDHNPLYRYISDRIIEVGPNAGVEGGYVTEYKNLTKEQKSHSPSLDFAIECVRKPEFKTVNFQAKHNIHLTSLKFPKETVTVVVGSSGSGKSTLLLDLVYNALLIEGENVVKLDSKQPSKAPSSIVATYLDIFSEIRKIYAKQTATYLSESDFSFNASGACIQCNGSGLDNEKTCGGCFGSRFRPEILLVKVEGKSIVDLLNLDIQQIDTDGVFGFLYEVIHIFEALSLTHIALGRATSTLSGGEVQRLKLAKFILNNHKSISKDGTYVILDEPCRGLDQKAVLKLHHLISHRLTNCSVLVIEHNPDFIYKCSYIIDLGESRSKKNSMNIVAGFAKEKLFPSLNHKAVFDEVQTLAKRRERSISLSTATSNNLIKPLQLQEGKRYQFVHTVFKAQENFALEDRFASNFDVVINDNNVHFYHSKNSMQEAASFSSNFLYNPFINFLEKYSKVPTSIYTEVLSKLNKADVISDPDPWKVLVKAATFEEAFFKGCGVVATSTENGVAAFNNSIFHTIRLFSIVDRIIDSIDPASFAFNLHRNACPYCKGYGYLKSYPFKEWINNKYSVLDPEMTPYKLNRVIPKNVILRFAKEGLFDFSSAVNKLTQDEINILLYGFKAYRFKKNGRSGKADDDFLEWRGLNSYIYQNAIKLSPSGKLNQYLNWIPCPFCQSGFRATIERYTHQGNTFLEYLNVEGLRKRE